MGKENSIILALLLITGSIFIFLIFLIEKTF